MEVNIDINLNDIVKVYLVEPGRQAAHDYHRRLLEGLNVRQHKIITRAFKQQFTQEILDGEKPLELPLWELMEIFGSHTVQGAPSLFFTNTVTLVKKEKP